MSNLEITEHILDLLNQPAFSVKDGTVVHVNHFAKGLHIGEGDKIASLISDDPDAYQRFESGCLYLTLKIMDDTKGATVTRKDQTDIFVLDDPGSSDHLHALSLAGQQLRIPLSNIISLLHTHFKYSDQEVDGVTAQIKHNIYQLYRMITNMCDAATWCERATVSETLNVTGIFTEIMEKCASVLASENIKLNYSCPSRPIYTIANKDMLERALLNMISNASKFADPNSIIEAEMLQIGNQIRLCIKNQYSNGQQDLLGTVFAQYMRKPGIEDPRLGIGLGLSLIRTAATSHGGTVLIDQPEPDTIRVSMTLAIRKQGAPFKLRSPSLRISNYAGGFDLTLLELSQLLADEAYNRN